MNKNYYLTAIGICLLIILSIFSIYIYNELSLYKEYIPLIIIILTIVIITTIILYFSKNITKYNIGSFIMILCNIILIYNLYDINSKNEYITNLITHKYTYQTYNIYVQRKNTHYSNINKLENKNIGILNENKENVTNYLNNIIKSNVITYENVDEISKALENGKIQGFILTENAYNKTDFELKYKVKIIYQDKIKEEQ